MNTNVKADGKIPNKARNKKNVPRFIKARVKCTLQGGREITSQTVLLDRMFILWHILQGK